jgi:hypothetical protein
MGNASAHLQIRLDSAASSQKISGVVFLKVDDDKYECDELRLQVRGSEITAVDYHTDKHQRTAHEQYHFLQSDCVLANFHGAARKGEYEFPFQVNLPPGLPATIYKHHYKTTYCIQARLHREGWTKWDVESPEYPLHQVGMQQSHDGQQFPQILVPRADPVYYCCCIGTGTMYTGGAVSNTQVAPFSNIKFTYVLDNQSTSATKEMTVRLVETVNFRASGHSDAHTRTVAEQRVSLSSGRDPAPTDKARSPALDEATVRRLAGALARPDAPSVTLQVPAGVLPSYHGRLIQVRLCHGARPRPVSSLPSRTLPFHQPQYRDTRRKREREKGLLQCCFKESDRCKRLLKRQRDQGEEAGGREMERLRDGEERQH